jgi:hypothetical protein
MLGIESWVPLKVKRAQVNSKTAKSGFILPINLLSAPLENESKTFVGTVAKGLSPYL